jgi:tetratricopeptide (TPR) repeat protein
MSQEKDDLYVSSPANRAGASLESYREYLRSGVNQAEDWFRLANQLHGERHYIEAADCYQRCLDLEPRLLEAHYNLGNTLIDLGDYDQAERSFQRCLDLNPEYADAHFNRGIACSEAGRLDEAIAAYRRAIDIEPTRSEAYYNLGIACHELGRLDAAAAAYGRALELKPDFAEACNNLGTVLKDQNALDAAASLFNRALELRSDYADAFYNLGSVRHEQHRLTEAIAAYQAALAVQPNHFKACNNLAKAYQDLSEMEQAVFWYRRALSIKPDYAEARFNLATAQLLRGNFEEGWPDYEWRFQRSDWKRTYSYRLERPRWEGESFIGRTLLVHCEQGFGDMLQFVRYVPMVKAHGGTVILETRQALRRLFEKLPGVDRLVLFSPDHPSAVDYDLYVPLVSLPGIFQTSLETIPGQVPYLHADPSEVMQLQSCITGEELRVGLVWAGTATDPRRATPLAWFAPLAGIEGLKIFGLQKGPAVELLEMEGPPQGMLIENLGPRLEDFSDTAAAIENLDLIVSIDTSVAHLAGAMGKPVYLLLPDIPDWRWMLEREDSPWYPSMRLFRQERAGDWGPPLTRIARRLDSLARNLQRAQFVPGPSGLLAAAAHFHKQGNLIEALIFYRRLLGKEPDHPEALHGLGLVALQTGNPMRATDLINQALARSPAADRYAYHLGLAFLALNRPEQASAAFQQACDLNPSNADAEFNLKRLRRSGS